MYRKELSYYFSTPVAYIVIGLYLLVISLMLWVVPGQWNIIDSGYAQVDGLFGLSPWLFLLLCPALTMRLIAEEKQTGTWYVLCSKPIALWRIVLAKLLAAWTILIIALLPCLIHFFAVYLIAEPMGNVDTGAFFGAYIGLFFLSAAFLSVGIWTSSLTKSQIVAFILGVVCCFVLYYGFDLLASMFRDGRVVNAIERIGFHQHFTSIARGVIDLSDMIYFTTTTLLFYLLTQITCHYKLTN